MTPRVDAPNEMYLFALRRDLDLSREQMARLLAVSSTTLKRWELRNALPSNVHQRVRILVSQILEMRDLGLTVYTPAGFQMFLKSPMPSFDGQTAVQMIEQGLIEEVTSEFAGDFEGLGC